jgi:nucleoside-diphosphate-sugar epimerase
MKKKILIVGYAGYVGSVLTPFLKNNNFEVLGVDTHYFNNINFYKGSLNYLYPQIIINSDIRSLNFMNIPKDLYAIIFLSAISNDPMGSQFKSATHEINTSSCLRLAKFCKKIGIKRFIFASSCSLYGASGNVSKKETDKLEPITEYALSKANAEDGLLKLADKNFQVFALRFSTACGYSPNMRFDLVLNDFVLNATIKKSIHLLSSGESWRPLIHVNDMAKAFLWAINYNPKSYFFPVNIGLNSWNIKIADLAFKISKLIPNTKVKITKNSFFDKRSYTVDFRLFEKSASNKYLPNVTLKYAVKNLENMIQQFNYNYVNFRKSDNWIRLEKLKKLIKLKQLNKELYWNYS